MHPICDCHMHVFDPAVPYAPNMPLLPAPALMNDYLPVAREMQVGRCVVVTPSAYGADNRAAEATLSAYPDFCRGVAVVAPDIAPQELARLDGLGFRGIRFNLIQGGPSRVEDIPALAQKVAAFGWHVQIYADLLRQPDILALCDDLPVEVVFDHIGLLRETGQTFDKLVRLLETGKAWAKLSGPYLAVPTERFWDLAALLIKRVPHRLVWASDWPHATETHRPDTMRLFERLQQCLADRAIADLVLRDNPARLYRF